MGYHAKGYKGEPAVKVWTHIESDSTGYLRVQVLAELSWAFGWNEVQHCKASRLESTLNKMYRNLRADIFARDRELNIKTYHHRAKV